MIKGITRTGILLLTSISLIHALPQADKVMVKKGERKMFLMKNNKIFRSYQIGLGKNPRGHKRKKGDNRTPEGRYLIDWRNAKSKYYKSLHISYPRSDDIEAADGRGDDPGGMIMIHGMPNKYPRAGKYMRGIDWTNGCIAVTNEEMDEIWRCVADSVVIEILP
ncbi:MAG: L,D-transpeptidase family protein [Chitinivibrionales bacterium]|nr:L,D-transpeptidase family protein [Chitinivibrionales bacterium]